MSNLVTKTKIKDAFRELTSQSSFAKVKVADIIAKAGISRMTFYRYYLEKYHLLEETLYDDFTRFENIYGKNVTWKDMVMSILYVICNNKPFYKKILEDSEAKEYYFETSRRISYQYTGDTAENGTYIAWEGTLSQWAQNDFRETPEEVYRTVVSNLPLREVLSGQELERAIQKYESTTMEDFKQRNQKS